MTKQIVLALALVAIGLSSSAQNPKGDYEQWKQQQRAGYKAFKEDAHKKYEEFRKKANEEYAIFMLEGWKQMPIEPAIPMPKIPKPPHPVVAPPDKIPTADPIPYDTIVPLGDLPLTHELPPLPTLDEPEEEPTPTITPKPQKPQQFRFSFYGTDCMVRWDERNRFKLKDLKEKTLSDAWTKLSSEEYDPLLEDIIKAAERMMLNDWGVVDLVRRAAISCMGKDGSESTFLADYLLAQLGAKTSLANADGRLVLLVALAETVYNYSYVEIDGTPYYILDKTNASSFLVLQQPFPKSESVNVRFKNVPVLNVEKTSARVFSSDGYPAMRVSIAENKNLIDFFDHCPITTSWDAYSHTSISKEAKCVLYPMLKKQIGDKSQIEAANMLLNFVQTCFQYATDGDQFGYERPLYADESFYYPANDCEDRSILYSILVRELLGLDVVLLEFPQHLATAVKFKTKVEGDYLDLDDGRYIVCDPTYIGAPVGMAMPECKNTGVTVHKLK